MKGAKQINGSQILEALPFVMKKQTRRDQASSTHVYMTKFLRNSNFYSQDVHGVFGIPISEKHRYARRSTQQLFIVVADARGSKFSAAAMHFMPSSPEGRLLRCTLQSKKHLFPFAVSEILDELVSHKDEAAALKAEYLSFQEPVLSRRIAETKEKERQVAVEDVIYMSIFHMFSEFKVGMVSNPSECVTKCRELESIHSLDIQEIIKEHVINVFLQSRTTNQISTAKIDRLHLERIYAASVLYGYFLKSASSRQQHYSSSLSSSEESIAEGKYLLIEGVCPVVFDNFVTFSQLKSTHDTDPCQESQRCNESSYAMGGLDSESLKRCQKLKSKEAANLIETHTSALFANEEFGKIRSDNTIDITFPCLERLVFEAATFGFFLNDVEREVDLVYRLEAV